jgi:hypothetical protein
MPLLTSIIAASRRRVDPDAADYFARIAAAGSTISAGNQAAVNSFVVGCKADGIWNAIKASCLLAGPDTLTGALVPLVGVAPTNNNFVDADYNIINGLTGNGSNKWIVSNRNNNTDPQDNHSCGVWVSAINTFGNTYYLGATTNSTGALNLGQTNVNAFTLRNRSSAGENPNVVGGKLGFVGMSRVNGSGYTFRRDSGNVEITRASETPANQNVFIFARGTSNGVCDHRLSFYQIGESLDLALLDARISTYMASIS